MTVLAWIAVALMGYAIQRGGTCTVAAVEELVRAQRATRLLAMLEASAWVAGGLALLHAAGRLPVVPLPHTVSRFTFIGAAMLGLGAWVNRACVFGAIARWGNGEWAYAATPLGFYAACASLPQLLDLPRAPTPADLSPVLAFSPVAALAFLVFAAWRLRTPARAALRRAPVPAVLPSIARRVWAPHAATCVIGVTFLVAWVTAGATWAYTDVLADLARGMSALLTERTGLFVALLLGALVGGYTAGRLRPSLPTPGGLLRCFAGGLLMGWGTLLIPGANDGLILVGLPLLWPYAWLAFGTMVLVIAAAIRGAAAQSTRRASPLEERA